MWASAPPRGVRVFYWNGKDVPGSGEYPLSWVMDVSCGLFVFVVVDSCRILEDFCFAPAFFCRDVSCFSCQLS